MSLAAAIHPLVLIPVVPFLVAMLLVAGVPRPRMVAFTTIAGCVGIWGGTWLTSVSGSIGVELELASLTGTQWVSHLDAFGLALALSVALVMLCAVSLTPAVGRLALAFSLIFFGAVWTLIATRDAYVFVAAYGVLAGALAFHCVSSSEVPSIRAEVYRFSAVRLLGLACFAAVLTFLWFQTSLQTGFASTEFSRLRALAWLSGQARPWFLLTVLATFSTTGLFPFHRSVIRLWCAASSASRLLILVFLSVVGLLWLDRCLVGLFPEQTRAATFGITVWILAHMTWLVLFRTRTWSERVVRASLGFVGLAWLALLSFDASVIPWAWLGVIHFLLLGSVHVGFRRPSYRSLSWIATMAWLGLPGFVGFSLLASTLATHWRDEPWFSACLAAVWLLLALRLLVSSIGRDEERGERGSEEASAQMGQRLAMIAAVALALGLSGAAESFRVWFEPATDAFVRERYQQP